MWGAVDEAQHPNPALHVFNVTEGGLSLVLKVGYAVLGHCNDLLLGGDLIFQCPNSAEESSDVLLPQSVSHLEGVVLRSR